MRRLTTVLAGGLLGVASFGVSSALAEVSFHIANNTEAVFTDADVTQMQSMRSGSVIELHVGDAIAAAVATAARDGGGLEIIVDGSTVGTVSVRASGETAVLYGMKKALAEHMWNVLGITGAPSNAVKISVVTDTATIRSGGTFTADVFIDGVADLRVYQVRVTATSASTGRLVATGLIIDQARDDYIFGPVGSQNLISAEDTVGKRLGGLLIQGSVDGSGYLGTYTFAVPKDVNDVFYVNVEVGEESFLRSDDAQVIPFQLGSPAVVTSGSGVNVDKGRTIRN